MTLVLKRARQHVQNGLKMRDRDIRAAVLQKVICDHLTDPNTLVVEELGLQHGANRVDIAVVNGALHGYELKSEVDTLDRLPSQAEAYSKVFDRATLVTAENHLAQAISLVPAWWGIKVATRGTRGAVLFDTYRRVECNPSVSTFHVAQLLWRTEAVAILGALGVEEKALRKNRAGLYSLLTDLLSPSQLRSRVREALKARKDWRCPGPRVSCGDSIQHTAT